MIKLSEKARGYERYRHTAREKVFLQLNGLQHVLSSNVSSVGTKIDAFNNNALIIRFHNGSIYEYPGRAGDLENILKSNSKGKWVWRNLRRKNAPYRKTGKIPLPDDIGVTDEEIFQEIDNRYMSDLVQHVDVPVFQSFEFIKGINMHKITIGGIEVYRPILKPLETVEPKEAIMYDNLQFETYESLVAYLIDKELTVSEIEDVLLEMKLDEQTIKELLKESNG